VLQSGYYCGPSTGAIGDASPPLPCPAGRYAAGRTGLSSAAECVACPAGSYCVQGSDWPVPCPPGTFNENALGASLGSCSPCTFGSACSLAGLTTPSSTCSAGHYCPSGTVFSFDNPCLAGTYSDVLFLTLPQQCFACPEGFYCPTGTGGPLNLPIACSAGYYCPAGSAVPLPCAPGTYSNTAYLRSAEECESCPAGSFCNAGVTAPSGSCAPGHYCPLRTPNNDSFPCPVGTFTAEVNLTDTYQCSVCPAGHKCVLGSVNPTMCPPGFYNSLPYQSSCQECVAGYQVLTS
jgi:hypothetical protein